MKTLQVRTGLNSASLTSLSDVKKNVMLEGVEIHSAVNQIPRAEISLTLQVNDNATIERCRVGYEVQILDEKVVLFNGVITRQNFIKRGGEQNELTLTLTCRHALFRLQTRIRSQLFRKQKDHVILSGLLSSVGVTPSIQEKDLDVEHEQMIQLNCSDWDFLRARVKANNVWLIPTTAGVVIRLPTLSAPPQHVLPEKTSARTLNAQWEFSYPSAPAGIEVSGWDIREQKPHTVAPIPTKAQSQLGSLKTEGGINLKYAQSWKVAYPAPLSERELSALSRAVSQRQEAINIRTEFECELNTHYALGDTIQLPGFASTLKGTAIITAVTHSFINGEKTTIATGLDDDDPDVPVLAPKIDGLYIGLVHDMEKDPTDCFRLQVTIPSLGISPNQPLWARFSQPYASEDSGICFYPEKNDEVILGFFDNDPRYPVILGSLHNPKKKAPVQYTSINELRGFVFKQKDQVQSLLFDRKASTVTLENRLHEAKARQVVRLDANKMTLSAENHKDEKHLQSLHFDVGAEVQTVGLLNKADDVAQSMDFSAAANTLSLGLQNTHTGKITQSLKFDGADNIHSVGLKNERSGEDKVKQSLDFNAGGKIVTVGLQNNHKQDVSQSLTFDAADNIHSVGLKNERSGEDKVKQSLDFNAGGKIVTVGLQNNHKQDVSQSLTFDAADSMTIGLKNTHENTLQQLLQLNASKMDLELSNSRLNSSGKQHLNFHIEKDNFTTLLSNADASSHGQTLNFAASAGKGTSEMKNTAAANNEQMLNFGGDVPILLHNTVQDKGIKMQAGANEDNMLSLNNTEFAVRTLKDNMLTLAKGIFDMGNGKSKVSYKEDTVTFNGAKFIFQTGNSPIPTPPILTLDNTALAVSTNDVNIKVKNVDIKGSTSVKIGPKVDLG